MVRPDFWLLVLLLRLIDFAAVVRFTRANHAFRHGASSTLTRFYIFVYLFIFTIKSVVIPAQSVIKKAQKPRLFTTLETTLKTIADFEF